MGRSDPSNKEPIEKHLILLSKSIRKKVVSILDLGIGEGDFGVMIREIFGKRANLHGVEIWKNYENENWFNYDKIFLMDIKNFLEEQTNCYDIVLLVDVLEHFGRDQGLKILNTVRNITKHCLILSTPITNYPQGTYLGNPYETHKYFWSDEGLIHLGFKELFRKNVYTWVKKPKFATLGIFIYTPPNKECKIFKTNFPLK